jgi:hypothetical protein
MKKVLVALLIVGCLPAFALIGPVLMDIMAKRAPNELIPVDVVFVKQMDAQLLRDAVDDLPRSRKRVEVARILQAFSAEHQKEILHFLKQMEQQGKVNTIKSFWINNAIYCLANREVIEVLAKHSAIRYVDYDIIEVKLELPQLPVVPDITREIAWGVLKIRAEQVWPLGFTGQGIVVGLIDTGVNYNHQDLADHMWTDSNYPYHGWNFELNNNNPIDEHGHGSHTAGSIASDGTAGSQCGVAPDAQVMALRVRNVADTLGENLIWEAMQFVVSPPASPGNGGDVISMSMGWQYQWNPRRAIWRTNCDNVGAAGIVMIIAAGNERGVNTPPDACRCPGDVPPPWWNPQNGATGALSDVVSIGATDINDQIASFSSPGPVTWQNIPPFNDYTYPPGLVRPDVSAPGVDVKSCSHTSNTGYTIMSGTSMATPHTAGLVALMLSKKPDLTLLEIDSILEITAVDLGPAGKDNDFGAGRIDAFNAITAVQIDAHNIAALNFLIPEPKTEELITIQPQIRFLNSGIFDENNIPVHCEIRLGATPIYTNSQIIPSLPQGNLTTVTFADFNVGVCGSHYNAVAYSTLAQDTIYYDDTTSLDFVAARIYEVPTPGCDAWKYPNADSGTLPIPMDPNWILATVAEVQQISTLDTSWWATAGAVDTAHQDLQLYGFQLDVPDTLIEELTVEWWGHHGNPPHDRCALYLWNDQVNTWSRRVTAIDVTNDVLLFATLLSDSAGMFINDSDYFYTSTGADVYVKACCPLLFTHNENEHIFIGDILAGCDLGMWIDRVLGVNLYFPPDYDEYTTIDADYLKNSQGVYKLTINEMLQEVTYLDEVGLLVIDHPAEYDVYSEQGLLCPGKQGLTIHSGIKQPLQAALDEKGKDVLYTLEAEDRMYVPFERSGITGFAKPFSVILDVGTLSDPGSAVLCMYGSTRFQDSDEISQASDIYEAREHGMRLQNPKVEIISSSGKWKKVASCGIPAGHKKLVTYSLYNEDGTIFETDDHRLRISFAGEVYLDHAWVTMKAGTYRLTELNAQSANLGFYGYAQYFSEDGKYPGDFDYATRVHRDYANIVGYYTKYGDVLPLLNHADNKFVVMHHGDEVELEFSADELPDLPIGWTRDFIFTSKGFYKMARPGRAYAYSVEPLPFYGMREDLSANGVGYYPYDPSPGLFGTLLGRLYAKIVFDYPFSFRDALAVVKTHLFGNVKRSYENDQDLVEYRQKWNTRQISEYYPAWYADLPPHKNLESVPLHETDGVWTSQLVSLGVPFGEHSLHSNYVRVWVVTTVPVGVEEKPGTAPNMLNLTISYPNPFYRGTNIQYAHPVKDDVKLSIYDANGRLIRQLIDQIQDSGTYSIRWDGCDKRGNTLPSGIYFIKFEVGEFNITKKAVLLK